MMVKADRIEISVECSFLTVDIVVWVEVFPDKRARRWGNR